jgi:UDP-N-acetylmuramoyl-L-alanyl-D-glutamate--2,6-diaminopimelate ligase
MITIFSTGRVRVKTTELFDGLPVHGEADLDINGITIDTRKLDPGDLFVALTGHEDDGHEYLTEAEREGARAVLVNDDRLTMTDSLNIPAFSTNDTRDFLPSLLQSYYGDPSSELKLIGVTGTNGKTTTTHLIESILKSSDESTGLIGTIERRFAGETHKGDCTTPSIVDTYKLLRDWSDRGASAVVMEVSSHALDQGRVRGLTFSAAAFTNLSQEHLDYHDDMDDYYETKKKLFEQSKTNLAYSDGKYGQRMVEDTGATAVGKGGDYTVLDPAVNLEGIQFDLRTPDSGTLSLQSPLTGLFNYKNISLAAALGLEIGISPEDVKQGVLDSGTVAGRCEQLDGPPRVIVDYAHTPDAMENVLESLTPLVDGETICVFGAGGDRDRGKRPKMGQIGVNQSDYAIVTSDNPRTESPQAIIDDILEGINGRSNYHVQVDRGQAIRDAIERGDEGDLVLIVGRGHETEQIIGDQVIPFEDRAVAKEVLDHRN